MQPIIPYFERVVFTLPIGDGIQLHGFGILVAIGFLMGAQLAQRKCRRDGLDPEVINRLLGWIVAGVFIGGHLGHALAYDPKHYLANPIELLKVWEGLSSFGGFFMSALLIWIFHKINKLNFYHYGDTLAYGLTLGWFLGRMGCTAAHDHPGLVTNFWLGVPGMCPGGDPLVACHDLGFYEALYSLSMLFIFIILDRKPRFPGFFMGVLVTSYAPIRFLMDIIRHPSTDARYFGLTPAQYGAMIIFPLGIWFLIARRNQKSVRKT